MLGLSGRGAWAQVLCGMWDPPGSGIELVSPVLAGRFFTTEPSRKLSNRLFKRQLIFWSGNEYMSKVQKGI